jgi:hypothetical protein
LDDARVIIAAKEALVDTRWESGVTRVVTRSRAAASPLSSMTM